MPKYRLTRLSFHGGALCPAGSVVDFDGIPGSNMEAMDAEGEAAIAKALAARTKPRPGSVQSDSRKLIEIPDGWQEFNPSALVTLARKLGAPLGTNRDTARTFINDEIARRATV